MRTKGNIIQLSPTLHGHDATLLPHMYIGGGSSVALEVVAAEEQAQVLTEISSV